MKNKKISLTVVTAALAAWCATSAAQAVYRCGDSYGQQPCAGGRELAAQDPRTASQQSQTREAAQRDAKAADAMEKARVKEEAKPAQVLLPPAKSAEPIEPENRNTVSTTARKPAYFTAVSPRKPGEPTKKKKKKTKKMA